MNPEPLDAGISLLLRGDLSQQDNSISRGQEHQGIHHSLETPEPLVYRAYLHQFSQNFTFPCVFLFSPCVTELIHMLSAQAISCDAAES